MSYPLSSLSSAQQETVLNAIFGAMKEREERGSPIALLGYQEVRLLRDECFPMSSNVIRVNFSGGNAQQLCGGSTVETEAVRRVFYTAFFVDPRAAIDTIRPLVFGEKDPPPVFTRLRLSIGLSSPLTFPHFALATAIKAIDRLSAEEISPLMDNLTVVVLGKTDPGSFRGGLRVVEYDRFTPEDLPREPEPTPDPAPLDLSKHHLAPPPPLFRRR